MQNYFQAPMPSVAKPVKMAVVIMAMLTVLPSTCQAYMGESNAKMMMYGAELNGTNEVPPVNSPSTGLFTLVPVSGGMLNFTLWVKDITDFTMAHIHMGNASSDGPIVVILIPLPSQSQMTMGGLPQLSPPLNGSFTFSGMISSSDFMGPLSGKTVDSFLGELTSPDYYYINVHSKAHPAGEIRGQLGPVMATSSPWDSMMMS